MRLFDLVGDGIDAWTPAVDDDDLEKVTRILQGMGQPAADFALGLVRYLERAGAIKIPLRLARTHENRDGLWLVEPGQGWYSPCLAPVDVAPCAVLIATSSNPRYDLDIFYGDDPDVPRHWSRRYSLRLDDGTVTLRFGGGEQVLADATAGDWARYLVWRETYAI